MGHPEIITENFADISTYFGLIKCTVLPPRGLFHPVLPYRTKDKLMFPLCKTCADTLNQNPCTHTDQERAILDGYPKDCVTDEQKQRYSDEYYEHEGIRLDPNKIEYNSGLRSLAKLALNSLWGKLLFVIVIPSLAQLVERGTVVKKS